MRSGLFSLVLAFTVGMVPANRSAAGDWSSWLSVAGDYGISYRWKGNTYGSYMTPDCEVEFKNYSGKADFRFTVRYSDGGQESGEAYGITQSDTFTEVVNPCRWVSSVTVTNVRRR
jgi:hypothetical protein